MAKRKHRRRYRGPDLTSDLGIEVGDTLQLEAGDFNEQGLATAELDNVPVTISGAIPRERISARIVKIYRDRVATQFESAEEPSDHRVEAECRYFGECSGCQWQHITYSRQLELKREQVSAALSQYDSLRGVHVAETLPSPKRFGYRNHARFTVGRGGQQGNAGFVNADTRRFVQIDECLIMDHRINDTLAKLQGRLDRMTQFSIRVGTNTSDMIIQPLLPAEIQDIPSGRQKYVEEVRGSTFQVAASSFFQVNTDMLSAVVDQIVEMLKIDSDDTLIDLYCGVGTFARLLAPYVDDVIGIEESASAVADARINCQDVSNVSFIEAKVENAAAELVESGRHVDVAVIDPPRTGCAPEALDALCRIVPDQIMMVSCNPYTLARDLNALCQSGFTLISVRPIDMFPHTRHVESLALLRSEPTNQHQVSSS